MGEILNEITQKVAFLEHIFEKRSSPKPLVFCYLKVKEVLLNKAKFNNDFLL